MGWRLRSVLKMMKLIEVSWKLKSVLRLMKLRSFSSERGLIEDDDVRDVCGVTGGVEVEVEDDGVHPPLGCLGCDIRGI